MSLVKVDVAYLNRYFAQLEQEIDAIENEIQSLKLSNDNLSWEGLTRTIYNSVQDLVFLDAKKSMNEVKLVLQTGKLHLRAVEEIQNLQTEEIIS